MEILITRTDDWQESYNVWGKAGSAPIEDGDGFFIGNYPIEPDETEIQISWTPPGAGTYAFLVIPVTRREVGIAAQVTP